MFTFHEESSEITIQGYASYFGNQDSMNDIVQPGAFLKCIERNQKLPVYYHHDVMQLIGFVTRMKETSKGLYVQIKLWQCPRFEELHKILKNGMQMGLSIGYRVKQSRYEDPIRLIDQAELLEISVSFLPANKLCLLSATPFDEEV